MVDDAEREPVAAPSSMRTAIILAIMVLAPACLALGLYLFVLSPMLGGEAGEEVEVEYDGVIPPTARTIELPEERATVLTLDPEEAAPLLIFQVALVCANQATADLVASNVVFFRAKMLELHSNRTRSELTDPHVQRRILQQATQEANELLARFDRSGGLRVLEVLHLQFFFYDL